MVCMKLVFDGVSHLSAICFQTGIILQMPV
jgi:hypothetical protein